MMICNVFIDQDPVRHPEHESTFNTLAFWREGHNAQRQRVVTPRVLMFDLKDHWRDKFIQKSNDLPTPKAVAGTPTQSGTSQHLLDKIEKGVAWDGKVQRVNLGNDSSEYEDSEQSSPYDFGHWGDYAKWRLHSADKCAFRIPNFMYNSESDELVSYGQGLGIYHKLEEIVEDGIRLYAEDCDHLEVNTLILILIVENTGFEWKDKNILMLLISIHAPSLYVHLSFSNFWFVNLNFLRVFKCLLMSMMGLLEYPVEFWNIWEMNTTRKLALG